MKESIARCLPKFAAWFWDLFLAQILRVIMSSNTVVLKKVNNATNAVIVSLIAVPLFETMLVEGLSTGQKLAKGE